MSECKYEDCGDGTRVCLTHDDDLCLYPGERCVNDRKGEASEHVHRSQDQVHPRKGGG